jgi:hypothetical protein
MIPAGKRSCQATQIYCIVPSSNTHSVHVKSTDLSHLCKCLAPQNDEGPSRLYHRYFLEE